MRAETVSTICLTIWRRIRTIRIPVVLLLGVLLGYWMRGVLAPETHIPASLEYETGETPETSLWTCSMHPEIRRPEPGLCPKCGMRLIPVRKSDAGPAAYVISESARALMDLQTARVERRFVEADIRMVGKVDYDETRLATISAWVPGRIDRLYVDYTGIQVRKGDHMVLLYSPELLTAQHELRTASEALSRIGPAASQMLRETGAATVSAARERLRRWGLTEEQIRAAESKDSLSDHVTIYAPIGGTVIERNGTEGMYVMTGEVIYRIADLSKVWVKLEAYESDLAWLHYGQTVLFSPEAYPGETYTGRISFIDPVLNPATRTVRVRVNVANLDGRLKPEMFVRAVVHAKVATGGRIMDPGLAGKWISPMHPEVIKDGPGACDVCGMPLVRAEALGYVSAEVRPTDMPLVIPVSAPLITGKRAVVYVEVPGTEKPTFAGREIILGPRAGAFYLVESGLEEGEIVVTNGNFKIDSALQIQAKPSMMNPEEQRMPPVEPAGAEAERPAPPDRFATQLFGVIETYFAVQQALAEDDAHGAAAALAPLQDALRKVDMTLLAGDAHEEWMARLKILEQGINAFDRAGHDIEAQRGAFRTISAALIQSAERFGIGPSAVSHVVHCPMAFDDEGADWLQKDEEVRNPYFGAAMLECGSVTRSIGAAGGAGGHTGE